ncbi:MAG: histidine phosphatase family protein [Desulfobacteraceae bacterium]|nr:histidine phosphatase family protein [Desulfobacteraceae bacterium]
MPRKKPRTRTGDQRILLVRHGESREQSGETTDGVDPMLSARGELQIGTLRERLASLRFDTVYVSPLARAAHTFDRAGFRCGRAVYDSRIIEIEWRPDWYGGMPAGSLPPGPEPDRHRAWLVPTYERLAGFLAEILASGESLIALVGHQGAFRCLAELFLGLAHDGEPIRLRSDNCSVSELSVGTDGIRFVRYWNDHHHVVRYL